MADETKDDPVVKSFREIAHSPAEVRVEWDGDFYAYRDGEYHVIVADGSTERTKFQKRVPAIRTHVDRPERLWTIPSNWTEIISTGNNRSPRYYNIKGTDVDVMIRGKDSAGVKDLQYEVIKAGKFVPRWDRDWYSFKLGNALDEAETDDAPAPVVEALRMINDDRDATEDAYFDYIASETKRRIAEKSITPDRGTVFREWDEPFSLSEFVERYTWLTNESHIRAVAAYISDADALPEYPNVKLWIDSNQVPQNYRLRALIQAGCRPPAAVDYLMVEHGGESQSQWAEERCIQQPSVSDNVRDAKEILEKQPEVLSW